METTLRYYFSLANKKIQKLETLSVGEAVGKQAQCLRFLVGHQDDMAPMDRYLATYFNIII